MKTSLDRGAAHAAAVTACFLLASSISHAGSSLPAIVALVLEGNAVPGIGAVTAVDAVTVNNAGTWLVEVDTSHADTNFDGAVLSASGVFVREGDSLAAPSGSTVDSFDSVWLNNLGEVAWNLFIGGQPTTQDSGLFLGTDLVLQEGTLSTAPQLSANTPYIGFFETRAIDDGRFFVVASVDDPAIASSVDRALVWIEVDPERASYTEVVIAKEGQLLDDLSDAVTDFGTGPENFAVNNAGQALFTASLTGVAATNGALFLDGELLARKGDASPEAGFFYSNLGTSTRVDLNDQGDWVMLTGLSGDAATNQIIVRNGTTVIQKGDPAPMLPGLTITGFGSGAPVRITSEGDVIWFATLSGPTATNQVLYRNNEILVMKGVSTVGAGIVTTIAGTTATGGIGEGFTISRDGRFILFRGVLDADLVGAFLVDLDPLLADFNDDGVVDGDDLGTLLGEWGACRGCQADLNDDGVVNGNDLGTLLGEWTS